MKNNILPFLLGIFVAISFAATTTNLLTVKPATPKSVVVYDGDSSGRKEFIYRYVKKGYIVKTVNQISGYGIIVMEKY